MHYEAVKCSKCNNLSLKNGEGYPKNSNGSEFRRTVFCIKKTENPKITTF